MTKDSGKLNGGSWECQTTCHFYFESLPSAHDILICWGQQILVLFSSSFFIVFRFMYYYYYYYHACVCNLYKMWENCEQIKKWWDFLEVVWMKGVLSDMIQNSSLIIQNWWDPRKKFCLDSITWFWSSYFGDSITQKTEWWSLKIKTDFSCFQIWSSMIQWHFRK